MEPRDRLIVAIDLSSRDEILALADRLRGLAGMFKIGLQAFIANGPSIAREIAARGEKIFLDLKIHDIPNTARHAITECASLGASMLTVHASGGEAMLASCVEAAAKAPADLRLLAVTVLTSLDSAELRRIGFEGTAVANAVRLACLARDAGLHGIVASPLEIQAIRHQCGDAFVIVTPGIRPAGSASDDQRRTLTPKEAIAAGADYLVIGRPIVMAKDPRAAASRIIDDISRG